MTPVKLARSQFTLATLLVFTAVCAVVFGLLRHAYNQKVGSERDSFTGLQLAVMMIGYLEANGDAWPESWDDLRPFQDAAGKLGTEFSFEEVCACWDIDFRADPIEFARAESNDERPLFPVFRQRYDRPMSRPQYDPNLRVFWRLRAHAALQTAAMVIEHMKANGNAWPASWDDLKSSYAAAVKPEGGPWCPFEQARACMAVDFKVDPAKLAQAKSENGRRPFEVIYPREGHTPDGLHDPNLRVWEYLQGAHSR